MTREDAIQYAEKKLDSAFCRLEMGYLNNGLRQIVSNEAEFFRVALSALRQQEPNDWVCTLKCTALMDEGMCSHGGLCCLYESQRTIKENEPLTHEEAETALKGENHEANPV